MGRCWFRCSLVVTRHWLLTPRARVSFIRCIFLLETSRTLHAAPIATPLCQLDFWPFQRVFPPPSSVSATLTASPGTRKDATSPLFRLFRRQLMHESLKTILTPLKPFMMKPDIVKCPDGHYRRAIYTLGPYIADYPEQVLLAAVVSGWCTW